MLCEPLASVEEMLAPEGLTALLHTSISEVHSVAFKTTDAKSGGQFLMIQTNQGTGPQLVLKRFSYDSDWIMRATNDDQGRAMQVWATGFLDRLPTEIVHGYLACARDGLGWAVLMRDLSTFLVPPGESSISVAVNAYLLDGMASLHATFWNQEDIFDPGLGFSQLELDYTVLTPKTGQREVGNSDPVPQMLSHAWDVLLATVEPAISQALGALADDPSPLCDALRTFPRTIVHADWKLGNLGLMSGTPLRVILLDWARVLAAPPVVDLAWYLAVNCDRLPVSKEDTMSCYRRCLETRLGRRIEERHWQAQLDLSLLGSFLQLGWSKALGVAHATSKEARRREEAELSWWTARIRPGIERL